MSRGEILRAHYAGQLKKVAAWAGLSALLMTSLVAFPVNAAQLTERSLTLGSSVVSASTTYAYSFKPGTTGNVGAIKFQLCTSPLEAVACTTPTGATQIGATGLALSGQIAGFTIGTGTPAAPTAQTVYITNGTPQSLTSGTVSGVSFTTIVNPSTADTTFYARITTYSDSAGTTQVDFGAVAVSVADQITVSANVQEQLYFCVFTGANCAAGGTTVNLGTGAENVLSTVNPTGGISKMEASTNASNGYVITYITTSPGGTGGTQCPGGLSSSNDCITEAGGTAVGAPADGTALFGLNLKANTTGLTPAGALGAAATGGTGAAIAPYATIDNIAFQAGATPRTVANTGGAPSITTAYTVTYVAQAGNTTKPGAYSATFTYIATGTF